MPRPPITPKQIQYIGWLRKELGMPAMNLSGKDIVWGNRKISEWKGELERMHAAGETTRERQHRKRAENIAAQKASPQVGTAPCPECRSTAKIYSHVILDGYMTGWCESCKMGWGPAAPDATGMLFY